ncbi:hypothetical protein [Conyzicola nivalis]|uniref:hypothetical protein n=1 Tax=Conyzicola nivalis TaxID=1477021 RepID=UPI00166D15F0|nr:hypothetical protein [Conyzicola nivalis]
MNLSSRLIAIGAMVSAVVAQSFYLWAATLTFWLGPGQSPTFDGGLLVAHITSAVLIVVAIVVLIVARALALAVTICVWALLLLINTGLWTVAGIPGMVTTVVLGWAWLARSRGLPQPK